MGERQDDPAPDDVDLDEASVWQPPREQGQSWWGWSRARAPRRGARLLVIATAIFLALLAILGGNPDLAAGANQLAFGWLPTPTPTLAPGDQVFYLLPNVPWGSVLLDGHVLSHLPLPGDPHPLRLARGRHEFEWRAAPFAPLHCSVWVPAEFRDGCWSTDATQSATLDPIPSAGGWLIPVNESLGTLPPDQHAMLVSAAQSALAATPYRAVVRRGELYALTMPGTAEQPVPATQNLLGTLTFHLLADFGIREPCSGSNIRIDPCRFPGQDCSEFCTVAPPVAPTSAWTVATMAWLSWDYTTLKGQEIARGQGDPGLNFRLVVLRITWTPGGWQVTPVFGHLPGVPSADDAVCAAARVWLARGPLADLLPAGNELTELDYFSGSAPADGCAAVLAPRVASSGGSAGPADAAGAAEPLFLVRFGVLLAANNAAHSLWPALPLADAGEAGVAMRLAGLTSATS